MKTYKFPIEKLEPNQIFVFGSNTQGRHRKGAALWAAANAGAIYGQAKGRQGQSYAIITKDLTKSSHPSVWWRDIYQQIKYLYKYASENPELDFLIAYRDAPNLNGYSPQEMASFFVIADVDIQIPDNIIFEESFAKLITNE